MAKTIEYRKQMVELCRQDALEFDTDSDWEALRVAKERLAAAEEDAARRGLYRKIGN